jgi:hypothetical protein
MLLTVFRVGPPERKTDFPNRPGPFHRANIMSLRNVNVSDAETQGSTFVGEIGV